MFRIGETFGQSVRTFFRNFVPFFSLAILGFIIVFIVLAVITVLFYGSLPNIFNPTFAELSEIERFMVENQTGLIILAIVVVFLMASVFIAINAAIVFGTIIDLRGKSAGLGDCISHGIASVPKAIGIGILYSLAVGSILLAGVIISAFLTGPDGVIAIIVMILTAIVMIVLYLRWYVVIPAMVVEDTGVVQSFSRSTNLTSGERWKILGVVLLSAAATFAIGFVVGLLERALFSAGLTFAPFIIEVILQAAFLAFSGVLIAVVYHDLRVAKEGLGTDEIAAVFD